MMSFRFAVLALTSVVAGLLLGPTAVGPDNYVTITSPSTIADVSSDGTPGATITGNAAYYYLGPSPSPASSSSSPERSVVTVDGTAVCDKGSVTRSCASKQIAMDVGGKDGQYAGSWTFFVPASVFRSSIDGLHTFTVEIYVIDSDGTPTLVGKDRRLIRLVPPGQLGHAPSAPAQQPSSSTSAPSPAASTLAVPNGTHTPGGHTASKLATGVADADSVYSALTPVQDVHLTATSAVILVAVTLILLLLIGFPGVLVESTVSEHYDELFPWVKRRREKEADPGSPAKVATWITVTLGVAIASIISGFVDPEFGLNLGSARLLLSSAVVFIVLSVIGWLIVEWVIHSTDPTLKPSIEFKWFSLLVVALAVLLSRLTGFEPGIVFGLIVGLSFGAALSTVQNARTVLVGIAYAFTLGLGSWLAYSALRPLLDSQPGVGSQFTLDLLAGMAVAGMSTLPVALLPIEGLGGAAVFKWNRWAWAVVYAAGLATFFVVLMPLPQAWGEISLSLWVWVILYACFAIGAILFWAFFRIKDGRATADAPRHGR